MRLSDAADLPLPQRVYRALQDGGLLGGATLARQLGVSRTAVWKAVGALRELGLRIDSVPRQGYRVTVPYVPLDAASIIAALPHPVRQALRHGDVRWETASTNAELLAAPPAEPGRFDFLLAEHQSAGRGRRGRKWFAAPGRALCLSIGWTYHALPPDAGALSLAVGVGVLRVLRRFGLQAPRLKWPNDVIVGTRKLAGILLELQAEAAGAARIVVGIGLNCHLDPDVRAEIAASGTECADLSDAGANGVDRNAWAAALIAETTLTLQTFGAEGFAPYRQDWQAADALAGTPVNVRGVQFEVAGMAEGIDGDGALLVRTGQGVQRFTSGDVSVRSQP